MHSLIVLREVGLTFADHICFENFSAELHAGDRVGLIGPNGSGKTSLLKLLAGEAAAGDSDNAAHIDGAIQRPPNLRVARSKQFPPREIAGQSGGEIFQSEFARALREDPDVLLLDEPDNHLDEGHRARLIRRLRDFPGSLVVASHKPELLRTLCTKLWVFEERPASSARASARYRLRIFHGDYDAYRQEREIEERAHSAEFLELRSRERSIKSEQERELRRAASSRRANRGENDRNLRRGMQERASRTKGKHGRRTAAARTRLQQDIVEHRECASHRRVPRFRFNFIPEDSRRRNGNSAIATVRSGSAGFQADERTIFAPLSFTLRAGESLGIRGNNGAGKSTLLAALRSAPGIYRQGEWHVPQASQDGFARIAWIDQFFAQLQPERTVLEEIMSVQPGWTHSRAREHLNDALFSTNAEIARRVADLSGGERARLSFARIAARPPRLLLLDEINNHLDLESRSTVIEALQNFARAGGAFVIASHDVDFLRALGLTSELRVFRRRPPRDSDAD